MGLFLGGYTTAFATPIGGHQLIEAAMAQRGVGLPITSQVSPASPTFSPATAPTPPAQPMTASPMGMPQQQMKPPMDQENIIIQALVKQLERIDKGKQMGVR